MRVAMVPDLRPKSEEVLDLYSSSYPTSGEVFIANPFSLSYKWEKKGWGDLLMLAHPLHLRLLSGNNSGNLVLNELKFKSVDAVLVGIAGDCWRMKVDPIPITWNSIRGIPFEFHPEIISALLKDVDALDSNPITTADCYIYGKQVARGARLALIAEEMNCTDVVPTVKKFLKDAIEPWLEGSFEGNGFFYDGRFGRITCKSVVSEKVKFKEDVPCNLELGYYVFSIAVLSKLDPDWGMKFRPQAYALVASLLSLSKQKDLHYARLRIFDTYKLHGIQSWVGSKLKTPGESLNVYYSAALLGVVFEDHHLVTFVSTLASLEIQATQSWWHVRHGMKSGYADKVHGVGNQVLPLTPITEILLSDEQFMKKMVDLAMMDLDVRPTRVYMHALEAICDKASALNWIRKIECFDEGNSLTNMLWWIHGRGVSDQLSRICLVDRKNCQCWFCAYCC